MCVYRSNVLESKGLEDGRGAYKGKTGKGDNN